jgi:cytochrome c
MLIRSENGRPLPENGKEMTALVAYIESLSGQNDGGAEPSGDIRGPMRRVSRF